MQKNFKETLINFRAIIIRNAKLIIFFQLISILFTILYFHNQSKNYTYSAVYQNAFSKIYEGGEYVIKKINPSFVSGMNFYYLDHYYENIYSTEFNISEECKKAEYRSRDYLSTKTDNGFRFNFEFIFKPKLTVIYKSNDMSKAKQCVEEYIKSLKRIDNANLKKLIKIENNKNELYQNIERTISAETLFILDEIRDLEIIKNFEFTHPLSIGFRSTLVDKLIIKKLNNIIEMFVSMKNMNQILYTHPIILNSEYIYVNENYNKNIFIISIFIFFGLFVSAIIIMIKDYRL